MRSFLFLIFLAPNILIAQEKKVLKFDRFSEFISYQNKNYNGIELGMTKEEIKKRMGESVVVAYKVQGSLGREKTDIQQPAFRDLTKDSLNNVIEILWYYTQTKVEDGITSKDECSPIILENNKCVGLGWGMFEDYRKTKKLQISLENN